jgi:glycosyltransferase involved in cell wall biosynthesis
MLLVLSSLWGAGGIPAFNRLLVRAAAEFAAAAGRSLRVVALTEAAGHEPPAGALAALQLATGLTGGYLGCGGSRRRCAQAVLAELPRRPLLVLGHVNLAPLSLGLGRYGVIAHGTEVWTPLPPLRRWALRRATAVGCVSEHTAGRVQQVQGVAAARCVRLINSLPAQPSRAAGDPSGPGAAGQGGLQLSSSLLTQPSGAAGDPRGSAQPAAGQGGPLRLLSVTRLHPAEPKGIDLVLRAIAALPQVEYTVVGAGDALPALQRLAAELGVAARVRFTGAISDAERDAELDRCEVFALPSRGEGFGIVYLEAMAAGKPCLAAAAGGAPEVVVDGQTGLVVPAAVAPVRAALQQLADSAELRQRLGQAGRARVAQCFSYPEFSARAQEFFLRIERPPAG